MNRKLKRIMFFTLALGMIFTMQLSVVVNTRLFITEVHALSDDADKLSSLELETSDGNNVDIYEDCDYEDKLSNDLYVGDIYFAKTVADDIELKSIGGASKNNVRIFIGDSDKAYKVGDEIRLSKGGATILKVRVYEEEYNEDKCYSSSTYNPYMVIVKNTAEVGE
ncbi:cell wall binding repeat-containing protein [Clostridium sp. DL-VIII]|uniref:hypothetical protein n=1 Tax=Clostridium sp. DL-VIII TaxID=641107 RepID=UPI00023B04CF|nr:hypothetical protein [Clostridium sp. DL-VIII]EHJ00800.1 cell wall binding repeat-containing protein [Clostridium sp. DL-VIII]